MSRVHRCMVRAGAHSASSQAVDGNLISSIGPGIVALIGICKDDTPDQMDMISSKLLGLKLWPESMHQSTIDSGQVTDKGVARPWRSSVMDIQGEVLCGTCTSATTPLTR